MFSMKRRLTLKIIKFFLGQKTEFFISEINQTVLCDCKPFPIIIFHIISYAGVINNITALINEFIGIFFYYDCLLLFFDMIFNYCL